MNTRSKSKQLATPAKSVQETRSRLGKSIAGGLSRSSKSDLVMTDASETPATSDPQVPGSSQQCPATSTNAEHINTPKSYRSRTSGSTRSSATIRAQRLIAEAQLARRSIEREQKLFEKERTLLDQVKQVEQLELEASLAAQKAEEHSGQSVSMSRTASWVRDVNQNRHCKEPEPGATGAPVTNTRSLALDADAPVPLIDHISDRNKQDNSVTVSLSRENVNLGSTNAAVDFLLRPGNQTRHLDQPLLNDSTLLLKAIADTATAAKALATAQDKPIRAKIELPKFFGDTSQWLQFKYLFDSTKNSYSPAENTARLHNALRGPAREAVTSLLHTAAAANEVMAALERTFACPEMIVFREVQVLKSLPRLSADIKEIGIFANKVRNSLSTMKLLGLREYIQSPELFHSILGKFNPVMKMRWSDFAAETLNPLASKLELLSDFLTREHERFVKFSLSPEMGLSSHTQQSVTRELAPITKSFKRENIHSLTHDKNKEQNKNECIFCQKNHNIRNCTEFTKLAVDDRWRWLREHKVCYKCLKRNQHQWKSCKVNPCGVDGCTFRHHPLLHGRQDTFSSPQTPDTQCNNAMCVTASPSDVQQTSYSSPAVHESSKDNLMVSNTGIKCDKDTTPINLHTLLKVVPITVFGPADSYQTYGLLDDGSTATLIDADVAARIGLSGPEECITVNGVGGLQKTTKISYVDFYIQGKHESNRFLVKRARAIPSLSLNTQTLSKRTVESYEHLHDIADYLTYSDATPTVLIGAEHWHLSISRDVRAGGRNDPVGCHTWLGWTLYGVVCGKTKPVEFVNHCQMDRAQLSEHEHLESLIKEHYKLDSLGIIKRETLHSKLDTRAIEILDSTTTRLPTGRYEVGLPWRDNIQCVPDSYPQALSRFLSLERRMIREPDFANAYKKFIDNMIAKGYAEECDPVTYHCNSGNTGTNLISQNNSHNCSSTVSLNKLQPKVDSHLSNENNNKIKRIRWYLPHFGVYHPQKRKLRVVHDAAAMNQGVSLNSLLLQGPDLLENLLGILFRFREGAVAITADIKEMFPQIRIRDQDRDALRFLWRNVQSRDTTPLKEYRMTAVIFGASSSPFTALYIKHKNAMLHQDSYPDAANASIHSSYMDDFLDSLDDVAEAARLASDVVTIHRDACFEMCGWISNEQEALRLVPVELRATQPTEVPLGSEPSCIRALGVSWDPITDTIGFRTGLEGVSLQSSLNKRKVLSHLMKVYDPLNLLVPIVVKGRILLQEAWRSNIDWDTPFPPSQVLKWNEWFKELSDVSSIKIPRWYAKLNGEPTHRELHIFADASELAYAAVAYWRLLYADGTVKLALITSKARVSPLRPCSIPRLEWQGALIASRLAVTIKEFHKKKPIRTFLWTDSRTVLGWLRSDARTFKPFVAHRVGEITENTCVHDWRWVPTDLNVADDATRIKPLHLNPNHRWFTGPSFLLDPPEGWPVPVEPAGQPTTLPECKQSSTLVVGHLVLTADFSRFNDWLRLLRATARVLQAAAKFRSVLDRVNVTAPNTDVRTRRNTNAPTSTTLIPLTAELMEVAERHVLEKVQSETFGEEIQQLKRGELLPKSSRLAKLSPKMGPNNLLRLAGRIAAVQDVGTEIKSPIILDGRHPVVRMLVHFYHRKAGHANNEMVVNEIRQKFWLLSLRSTVRNVASKCLFCRIKKAKPMNPMTGNLPPQRLAHHRRPFTYTGLDYFGPINTTIGRRQEKRYVALYTCMTSRAVHLELVHSLSADSAIMSLRRFIARRGAPDTIFSDNGTCFIGADRILREFCRSDVNDFAANRGIKWSFIPPAAPFFGGCWERLVRTVKVALNATLREKAPNPEVLVTLLQEAEAIVNSRPLTHVTVGTDDDETLTPFHFLIGSSSNQILPACLNDRDLLRRVDWRKALRLADHFWNRWVKEILPTMQPRQIGENRERNLEIGDLVLIVDENLPRGVWPRGRVTATFPGRDGIVRVVDVATSGGLLRRPSKKLVRLDT